MKVCRTTWIVFAVMVVAQWTVPAWQMAKYESVLRQGKRYRFRCAAVDPFDAFRGRYVIVDPRIGPAAWTNAEPLRSGQTVYVLLKEDAERFAEADRALSKPPAEGDYVAAYYRQSVSHNLIEVELPFNRFYMPEKLASRAEEVYREQARSTNAWLAVRIKNGAGVIENVFVDERPLAEAAREAAKTR